MQRKDWAARVDGLVVFRGLLQSEPLASLRAALAADAAGLTGAVAAFESALFTQGTNWTEVLLDAVLEDENLCLRTAAGGDAGPVLEKALENELEFLQQLGTAGLDDLCPEAPAFLPRWEVSPDANYAAAYQARRAAVGQKGYGMFARHHVFTIEDGRLVPVRYPDPQRLSELPGYEREREKVIANTRALLESKPTNNVLLYGDAGTGKSSTVKAIANEFAPDGLRLIEVKKNQLYQIPALMDELAKNPLKFILFIDDLSFSANDDNFAALKAILEGSVGGRSHNVAVYATSNRRHLVKESMSDRSGDDLHAAEGTDIYAAADGVVLAAQEHYSWGNFVEIDHGTDADGLRWVTLYAHMKSCAVVPGQTVTAGQVIGYVGHTGYTTGNACHFEMHVNGTLVEPRYFTAYDGSDAAELTQEKADEILAEAVRNASSDQVTAADGAAALSGVELFTLPVAPPPQVSGYDPENGHPGIDFAAEEGAEVYAVADGIVTTADYDAEKGNYVVLDHGGGLETEYQHLKSSLVSAGQSVVQCQVLGYVGSTGNSTGPHLHFEARQDSAPADLTGTALLAE